MRKDSWRIELNGVVDEAQAAIGVARAETPAGTEVNDRLVALARDLYVLMAEVATAPDNRSEAAGGVQPGDAGHGGGAGGRDRRSPGALRHAELTSPCPGENRVAAALDLARTIVRRAERLAVAEPADGSS